MRRKPQTISHDLIINALGYNADPYVRDKIYTAHIAHRLTDEIWPQVLGKTLTAYTTDLKLQNGTLFVRVLSAPLRNDLQMQRAVLIQKLNATAGQTYVKQIVFC